VFGEGDPPIVPHLIPSEMALPETLQYASAGTGRPKSRHLRRIVIIGTILVALALLFGPCVIMGPGD